MPTYVTEAKLAEKLAPINARITELVKRCNLLEATQQGDEAAAGRAEAEIAVIQGEIAKLEAEVAEPAPTPEPAPEPAPQPAPEPSALEKLIPTGFTRVRHDDCTDPEPRNLFGEGLPYDYTAVSRIGKGIFEGQAARTCTVLEGDHAGNSNAFRTELGHDENRYGLASESDHQGTFWLYYEGDHTLTVARRELPSNFNLSSGEFQTVLQIKQSNPGSEQSDVGPAIEIEARNGRWVLSNYWNELWSCPAHVSTPTTFVMETVHSADATKGAIKLTVLENGKQVAQSETFTCRTMSVDPVTGEPVPLHYRGGLYMSLKATPVPVTVVHGATEIWK